jgi:transposase InsO family protein
MSDNASEFRSAVFGQTVAKLAVRHTFIRAGRPQTNGCVERVQPTILDECWKPALPATSSPTDPAPAGSGTLAALLQHRTRPHRPLDRWPHSS